MQNIFKEKPMDIIYSDFRNPVDKSHHETLQVGRDTSFYHQSEIGHKWSFGMDSCEKENSIKVGNGIHLY